MPRRIRSRWFLLLLAVLVAAGAAGLRLARNRDRPPAAHPLLPTGPDPVSLDGPPPSPAELRSSAKGLNVVICVIDAARVDHMGCYGYSRDTTPNIDRLAEQSVVFEQHFCQYTQTKPSTASLFTALYPDTHLTFAKRTMETSTFTMAAGLREAGFHNACFSSNPWASPEMGIGADFDWIRPHRRVLPGRREPGPPPGGGRRGEGTEAATAAAPEALLEHIGQWLDGGPPNPFLAYVHFTPPHTPYSAPEEMKRVFAGKPVPNYWRGDYPFPEIEERGGAADHQSPSPELINLYDANFLWADRAVAQLEELLREAGHLDDTLLIVTADHGETFGEHGYKWHPACPYNESIHIPLLIRFPGGGPTGRVRALTQTVDLLPTIFDLLEVPYAENEIQGRSLVPLLTGEAEKVHDYVFCRTQGTPPAYVVRDLRYALILWEGGELRALYDMQADPWQTRNIIEEEPERSREMLDVFRRFAMSQRNPPMHFVDPDAPTADLPPVPEVRMSEQSRRELEALGYLR